jgi:hypothetical protein
MGSDRAPKPEVEGAIQAARRFGIHVALVGPEEQIKAELWRHPLARLLPISIVHASEVILMDDKALQAVRAKRDSSMRVGLRLVREGRAGAFITAGNTGAAMATAKMVLGGLPGVDRPALVAIMPTATRTVTALLDVGANVDCKPHNLEQFAVMGDIYFRSMFGTERPRVGLLSIGEEEGKGNELTREAFQLLKQLLEIEVMLRRQDFRAAVRGEIQDRPQLTKPVECVQAQRMILPAGREQRREPPIARAVDLADPGTQPGQGCLAIRAVDLPPPGRRDRLIAASASL